MALDHLAARHESLRTTFDTVDGRGVQVVAARGDIPVTTVDLSTVDKAGRDATVERVLARELGVPFDLRRGPLTRLVLVRLADDEHVLLFTQHHIVTDGWSVKVLIAELAELYSAAVRRRPSDARRSTSISRSVSGFVAERSSAADIVRSTIRRPFATSRIASASCSGVRSVPTKPSTPARNARLSRSTVGVTARMSMRLAGAARASRPAVWSACRSTPPAPVSLHRFVRPRPMSPLTRAEAFGGRWRAGPAPV